MIVKTPNVVNLSFYFYRLLLRLYPAEHREAYGPLMAQVFRDQCRDAYRSNGRYGVFCAWFPLMLDLVITLVQEHRQKGIPMSSETFARFSGPFLILAGVMLGIASISPLEPGYHYRTTIYQWILWLLIPGFLLMGVGMFGIRICFGLQIGPVGRLACLVASAGGVVASPCLLLLFTGIAVELWNVGYVAILGLMGGIIVFSIIAIQRHLLPRWAVVPVIISSLWTITTILIPNNNQPMVLDYGPKYDEFAGIAFLALSWIMLGWGVYIHSRQEQAVVATHT